MREFDFSEKIIREERRRLLVIFCFLALFIVIFALYISNFRIEEALIAVGITLLVVGIIFSVEIPLINRRLRKLKVLIYEDKLVKQCGKKQKVLLWDDIARMKVIEKKNGNVAIIRLYPKKSGVTMHLYGFREIEELAELIKERTLGKVMLQEKCWKINWLNPFVCMPMVGVPTMIVMFIIASMGSKAVDIFAILTTLSIGLLVLIFEPLTKFDICNKWVELTLGVILLILGFFALISFLLLGYVP